MNLSSLFGRPLQDIALGLRLSQLAASCNGPNPLNAFASVLGGSALDPDMGFYPGSTGKTNSIICKDAGRLVIVIGGATTALQIGTYIDSVADGPDPRDNLGCVRAFYGAGRSHLSDSFGHGGYVGQDVLIVGHSFGGAVAQVAGAYLLSLGQARSVSMVSFGAPRPGGPNLARRLGTASNVRWTNEGDIVPWLLPHLDEIPAMGLVAANTLWNQTNSLVQPPTAYRLGTAGFVTCAMDSPPRNWGYFLSLYNYVISLMVSGPGPNHSIDTYVRRFQLALAANPGLPSRAPQQPEAITTLRPRERDAVIAIGRAAIFADATSPTGTTRTYVVPPVTSQASPRYKPAKDVDIWVIKLGEDIVGAATGKRDARRIARAWNRSARAALRS